MSIVRINNLGITDGTIVNADIATAAAIATTKLGAGAVLQVVTATDTSSRSTTSTSFVTVSNTLSVSITPSSTANKILVLLTTNFLASGADSFISIFRDSTNLGTATHGMGLSGGGNWAPAALSILDSPSTTSAITYQVYLKAGSGATVYINDTGKGSITALEIKG